MIGAPCTSPYVNVEAFARYVRRRRRLRRPPLRHPELRRDAARRLLGFSRQRLLSPQIVEPNDLVSGMEARDGCTDEAVLANCNLSATNTFLV